MALRADERRDKLRKASGRSKYPMIRRYLNGETRLDRLQSSIRQSITYGREPGELKHLSSRRKRKQHVILSVAASEMERGQTGMRAFRGYGLHLRFFEANRTVLGKPAGEGESPVSERRADKAGSRVHRDTRNLDERNGDHPVRLNTP